MDQHAPLPNVYLLISIIGFFVVWWVWQISMAWGFLLLVMFLIMFIASFISAVRAPLDTDHDIELAIHQKYSAKKYPDTTLHQGNVKKTTVRQVKAKLRRKK